MHDPWTAETRTINQVIELFELTTAIVHAHKTSGSADPVTEGMVKMQMAELASVLFKCCHDRLEWLKRYAAAGNSHSTSIDGPHAAPTLPAMALQNMKGSCWVNGSTYFGRRF